MLLNLSTNLPAIAHQPTTPHTGLMNKTTDLTHHFIIAMPSQKADFFSKSVIYLHEHNDHGAQGLVINKPANIKLGKLLDYLSIECSDPTRQQHQVLIGGPVNQNNGLILYQQPKKKQYPLSVSTSKQTLSEIAHGKGPENFFVSLGYASWTADQLEMEIAENHWLIAPFCRDLVFQTPMKNRWQQAGRLLGINLNQLSGLVGHA